MTASLHLGETRVPALRARLKAPEPPPMVGRQRQFAAVPLLDFDDDVRIEDRDGNLTGAFHLRSAPGPEALGGSQLADLWDLSPLGGGRGPVVEFGDLRMRAEASLPDTLRAAWGAVATVAESTGAVAVLGACAFPGSGLAAHSQAFALLRADHVAPAEWLPSPRIPSAVPLASLGRRPDRIAAVLGLPPLLRSWLGLGAWVADHVVPNPATGMLEVLAILDPARIPPLRAQALRAVRPLA